MATLIARIATNGRPGLQTVAGVLPAMSSELEDQAMAKPQTSAHPQAMGEAGTHDRVTGQGCGWRGREPAGVATAVKPSATVMVSALRSPGATTIRPFTHSMALSLPSQNTASVNPAALSA